MLFRDDLRLSDNQALSAAVATGRQIVTAFIFDRESMAAQQRGAASLWWLHCSLAALAETLSKKGLKLVLRAGPHEEVVAQLLAETGANTVHWNRRYHPPGMECDIALKARLRESGANAESFAGHLLHEPPLLKTNSGGYFRVYTPFWKALSAVGDFGEPLPQPDKIDSFEGDIPSEDLNSWKLLPTKPDWASGMREAWTPGETGVREQIDSFLDEVIDGYADARDVPGRRTTSRLSPHLAHGEISPRQVCHAARKKAKGKNANDIEKFIKEVAWREFSYHLLFHNPDLATVNFNNRFDRFPWADNSGHLTAWKKGLTGYPIVDAGMRELWQTGWMHNRVRMICASFLIKHLLIDWREGERWFADTLVDSDPANNPASWQWVAGSGADAAPYFRIFNPMMQGAKFDPEGAYVRQYVPEISQLPDALIHTPWEAPESVLRAAGIELGKTYPKPIVDHARARDRAMEAFNQIKKAA